MNPEEEFAAKAFHAWLGEHGWKADWHEGPENECPDACFHVSLDEEKQKWAAEVTRVFQHVDWNGQPQTEKFLEVLVDSLCNRLAPCIPQGTKKQYLLAARGTFDLKRLKTVEERAIAYIRSGKTEEKCLDFKEALDEELRNIPEEARDPATMDAMKQAATGTARFFISAHDPEPSAETPFAPIVFNVWFHAKTKNPAGVLAGDIKSTLRFAVGKALEAKIPRLHKLNGYQRKVLLLVQEYGFAEPDRLAEVVAEFEKDGIDLILLIDTNGKAHLIHDAIGGKK